MFPTVKNLLLLSLLFSVTILFLSRLGGLRPKYSGSRGKSGNLYGDGSRVLQHGMVGSVASKTGYYSVSVAVWGFRSSVVILYKYFQEMPEIWSNKVTFL
jgi:hypothetical protein